MTSPPAAGHDTRSMRERMLGGDLYPADDPELVEAANVALDVLGAYDATTSWQVPLRRRLLEQLLGSVGANTVVGNTVVGAGTVVTRGLPANALAVGNPARVVREMVA